MCLIDVSGGPLTVTDANLILGRLIPEYFPALFGPRGNEPLDFNASSTKFDQLAETVECVVGQCETDFSFCVDQLFLERNRQETIDGRRNRSGIRSCGKREHESTHSSTDRGLWSSFRFECLHVDKLCLGKRFRSSRSRLGLFWRCRWSTRLCSTYRKRSKLTSTSSFD